MKVEILNAKDCAWRACYLYLNDRQVAYLSVDPHNGVTPTLSGMVLGAKFGFRLPTVHWRSNASTLYQRAYRLSSAFWCGVDGRFGWGTRP